MPSAPVTGFAANTARDAAPIATAAKMSESRYFMDIFSFERK
jgi:hypothetical protein